MEFQIETINYVYQTLEGFQEVCKIAENLYGLDYYVDYTCIHLWLMPDWSQYDLNTTSVGGREASPTYAYL